MNIPFLNPVSLLALAATFSAPALAAEVNILNASYDVSREFYKSYNPLFVQIWKQKTGDDLTINHTAVPANRRVL